MKKIPNLFHLLADPTHYIYFCQFHWMLDFTTFSVWRCQLEPTHAWSPSVNIWMHYHYEFSVHLVCLLVDPSTTFVYNNPPRPHVTYIKWNGAEQSSLDWLVCSHQCKACLKGKKGQYQFTCILYLKSFNSFTLPSDSPFQLGIEPNPNPQSCWSTATTNGKYIR